MKIALAPRYRTWMVLLLPSTLGLGSAVLWLRTLPWPVEIDPTGTGLTLRSHRRVAWSSIRKIGVSRSYLDGHISEMRIHHDRGVNKIPLNALEDGERVARIILAMFARIDSARTRNRRSAKAAAESRCRNIRPGSSASTHALAQF
jgi:hypothetical protein